MHGVEVDEFVLTHIFVCAAKNMVKKKMCNILFKKLKIIFILSNNTVNIKIDIMSC